MITGYIVMAVLAVVFLGISSIIASKFSGEGVDDFVAGGRKVPFGLVTSSVMVSWLWAITVIGSSEQGMVLGISGGINYAVGSMLPFFIFIPLVMTLRKKMPKCTTFVEFIKVRYGDGLSKVFIVFALLLTLYILLSQGMGVGVVFHTIFGVPYKVAAAVPILIVAVYVSRAGLKGFIVNDFIMFIIISVIMLVTIPIILRHFGIDAIYNGMLDAAANTSNPNYNPDALNLFSKSGRNYGLVCVIVCMGQILLDQGYYSKAISTASSKKLLLAYVIGTIFAWMPVPLLCGNVIGSVGASLHIRYSAVCLPCCIWKRRRKYSVHFNDFHGRIVNRRRCSFRRSVYLYGGYLQEVYQTGCDGGRTGEIREKNDHCDRRYHGSCCHVF